MTDRQAEVTHKQLLAYIERIERVEEEIKGLSDDKKDIYLELKGAGFDAKIVKKIISLRKKAEHARKEEEILLETYKAAIGME